MARAGEDIATAPIDLAIERIRAVYRSWNRDTTVAQMRGDWDAAFGGGTAAVLPPKAASQSSRICATDVSRFQLR